jgi:putative tryptophan/tyrosine transport system substrate-binding protein
MSLVILRRRPSAAPWLNDLTSTGALPLHEPFRWSAQSYLAYSHTSAGCSDCFDVMWQTVTGRSSAANFAHLRVRSAIWDFDVKRREFITLTAATVLAAPRRADAQGSERVRRVGIFSSLPFDDPAALTRLAAVSSRLKELGWVEGRNIQYERHLSNVDPALRSQAAKELVARKPDIIISSATRDLAALLDVTRTIPIVFSTSADPVGSGFVQSLARPGGNATGFTNSHESMGGKWLEILKEIAPRIARVGVLFNPDTAPRNGDYYLGPMKDLAPTFGIEVVAAPLHDAAAIAPTIAAYAGEPASGFVVTPDPFTVSYRKEIAAAAAQDRVPAIYPYYYFIAAGGLISYGFSYDAISPEKAEVVVTTTEYIDLILRGANPGDLPVRSPRNYELLVNLKAAKALGLTVPPALMARADKVIE